MKLAPGTRLAFSYKGQALEGTILAEEAGTFVIKLASGYNISAKESDVHDARELPATEKKTAKTAKSAAVPSAGHDAQDKGLPKITLLHTGGTIASRVDYSTGAVIAQYTAEEMLSLYPELQEIANVESRLLANMQSEMMRFGHWNVIAKAVEDAVKKGAQGVIVTHGTDIIAMSAAALAFALKDVPIPVILVGSQRSSDRPSSDAVTNLLCATAFIAKEHDAFRGVALCMHEGITKDDCVLLPPCRTRKMHTSRRDAFKAINDTPYARVAYPALSVERLKAYPAAPTGALDVKLFDEKLKIGLLHIHPHMYAEELLAYRGFDGLVLELLGIGHVPTMRTDAHNEENERILAALTEVARDIPVVAAPQTIYGRINMDIYSPGRQLIAAGVLGNGLDLVSETAFVKLAWLLSNYSAQEARKLYSEDLRGELSERSVEDGFLQ